MKICHILVKTFETEEEMAPYVALCEKTYSLCRSDTQVDTKAIKRGLDNSSDMAYEYFWLLNKKELVESVTEAEKEGYDAAVISCFEDPGVKEARSIVNIPVIGVGESNMMYATLLGSKFGIVTVKLPAFVQRITEQIKERGLERRAIANNPVRPHPMSDQDMLTVGVENPKLITDGVEKVGRELAKDGADVVITGCTGLGPQCTATGLVKLEPEGVPVLDCVAVALKIAEVVVDFRDKVGLPFISRGPIYQLPNEEDIKRVRALFGLGIS